jgi:nucleotide-binding universal stress UspA family protein
VANLPTMYRVDLKPDFINILLEDSERALLDTEGIFAEKKIKCERKLIREGKPSEVICGLAEKENCDLIVLGNLGLHSPNTYALGSQTYQITHEAPCSVWVVK